MDNPSHACKPQPLPPQFKSCLKSIQLWYKWHCWTLWAEQYFLLFSALLWYHKNYRSNIYQNWKRCILPPIYGVYIALISNSSSFSKSNTWIQYDVVNYRIALFFWVVHLLPSSLLVPYEGLSSPNELSQSLSVPLPSICWSSVL